MLCGSGPPFHWYGGGGPQPHGGAPLLSSHHSWLLLAHHGPLSQPSLPCPLPLPLPWPLPGPLPHHGGQKSSLPCPGFNGSGAAGCADATPAPRPATLAPRPTEPKLSPPTIMAAAATLISFIRVTPTRC